MRPKHVAESSASYSPLTALYSTDGHSVAASSIHNFSSQRVLLCMVVTLAILSAIFLLAIHLILQSELYGNSGGFLGFGTDGDDDDYMMIERNNGNGIIGGNSNGNGGSNIILPKTSEEEQKQTPANSPSSTTSSNKNNEQPSSSPTPPPPPPPPPSPTPTPTPPSSVPSEIPGIPATGATTQEQIQRYTYFIKDETLSQKLARIGRVDTSTNVDNPQRRIIITTATSGFKSFLYNWMCSILNMEKASSTITTTATSNTNEYSPSSSSLLGNLLIFTTDPKLAWELIIDRNFTNVFLDLRVNDKSDPGVSMDFLTLVYQRLIMYRTSFIREVLVEHNYRILLADNDAVWLRDPFQILLSKDYSGYDMLAQNDGKPDQNPLPCGGFLYLNNTSTMKSTWDKVTSDYSQLVANSKRPSYDNEQFMLQRLANKAYKVAYLPSNLFPNGFIYFGAQDPPKSLPDVYVVHNNFVIGASEKLRRFRRYPKYLWQVNDSQNFKCEPRVMLN